MIIAVVGGKGGVGKTTVSLNLGWALDAVIVDADLGATDFPQSQGPGIHDVLAGRVKSNEAVERIGSVDVLSANYATEGARAADLQRFPDAISRLDRMHEAVVIDCPAGLAQDIGVFLDTADFAVLVTTPKLPARADASRTRELAVELGTPLSTVVVNKVPDETYNSAGCEQLCTEIEAEFRAAPIPVPYQSSVATTQADGDPIGTVEPDSAAAQQFETLAERQRGIIIR